MQVESENERGGGGERKGGTSGMNVRGRKQNRPAVSGCEYTYDKKKTENKGK